MVHTDKLVLHHAQGMPYEPQITRYKTNLKKELVKPPPIAGSLRTPPHLRKLGGDVAAAQWNNFPGVGRGTLQKSDIRGPTGYSTPHLPFIDDRYP